MKELWLFTTRYPYGFREAFLENELPVLCARYDRVLIFPEHPEGQLRPMPPNAEVRLPLADPFARAGYSRLLRAAPEVLALMGALWKDAPSVRVLRRQWPYLRARIAQFIHRADVLSERIMPTYDPARVQVYAYWTHDWTTVLGLVQRRFPQLRFISRAHGFDVFEEQNRDHWIPFRSFQLRYVSKVHCASRTAMEHLQARHPGKIDLFTLSRLGTRDHGPGPHDPSGPLKVVSCSFLIPRKRVLRLVEALALVRTPVRWTHFGGGEEEDRIRAACATLPAHITVDLRGMMLNADIINWYRTHPVDVFVHLSHLEGGVAVAAQEATSFGIPVFAADSGGVRELVGPRTGVLWDKDPEPAQVAAALDGFRASVHSTADFRAGVRRAWQEGFEAEAVFHDFVDKLQSSTSVAR